VTPAAVDLIKLTQLEPPAPSSAPAGPVAGAPSFHEHLRQAERRTSDDAPLSTNRGSNTNPDSPPTKESDRPVEDRAAADGTEAAQEMKPPESGDERQDEHTTVDVAAITASHEATPTTPPATSVAVVALIAQPEVEAQTKEVQAEVVDEGSQKAIAIDKAIAAANPQTSLPVDASVTAVPAKVAGAVVLPAKEKNVATKSESSETNGRADVVAADLDVEVVRPVGEIEPPTKPAESVQSDFVPLPKVAAETEATNVAAPPTAADEVEPDKRSPHGRGDANKGAPEPGTTAPAAVAPNDAPAANLAPASVTDAAVTSTDAVVAASSPIDSATTSKPPHDAGPTARFDRTHVAEPLQPVAQREAGTGRTSTTDDTSSLSQADRFRLVQRVARAVQTAVDRGGDLKLRLSPPELGSLRLQVRLTDGALSARIETDNPAAKQVLIDNLPALRDRLADQNIRVEKFDVDLSNSGGGGASQNPQQPFSDSGAHAGRNGLQHATSARVVAEGVVERSAPPAVADGRLNVVV